MRPSYLLLTSTPVQVQPVVLVRRHGVLRRQADALERELDVVGRHLAEAVGEHLTRLQAELDDGRRDLLDLRRGVELELRGIGLLLHQALMDDSG